MPFPASKVYGVLNAEITQVEGEFTSHKTGMSHFNLISQDSAGLEYQINIDIQSSTSPNVRMLVLYDFDLAAQLPNIKGIESGFTALPTQAGGLALDLIHQPLFPISELKNAQPHSADNLSETLNALLQVGANVFVFGTRYDDSQSNYHQNFTDADESYRDHHLYGMRRHREQGRPPRGVDDVHLNQGTPSSQYQSKDNGLFQDGALFIANNDGSYTAVFFAFAQQCFNTNASGNCQ